MQSSLPPTRPAGPETKKGGRSAMTVTAAPFAPKSLGKPGASREPNISAFQYFKQVENSNGQKYMLHYKTSLCKELTTQGICMREAGGMGCFCFHNAEDRRRPVFKGDIIAYNAQLCPMAAVGKPCRNGDLCPYSHNQYEHLYHPSQYKTVQCNGSCMMSTNCPFAHSSEDFRSKSFIFPYFSLSPTTSSKPAAVRASAQPFFPQRPISSLPDKFNFETFKSKPCPLPYPHNIMRCQFYHSPADRRRVPVTYSFEKCLSQKSHGKCALEDRCNKSHNIIEQLYHPEKYKRKMCHGYPDRLDECEYGSYCSFAHSEAELKIEVLHEYEKDGDFYVFHFKTVWCPFNHEHNKSICVYAHNWQDFRRKPSLYKYSYEHCPQWDQDKFISEYKEGCSNELKCSYSHGWKEYLYHPHYYKTVPCQDPKCHKGTDCPYYHSLEDQRCPQPDEIILPRVRKRTTLKL